MSDKITTSKIYLFLASQDDWKAKADLNKNNEITKGEMRTYLSGDDFKEWCGESIANLSADVFNKFWASFDSEVANNKLDETELKNALTTVDNYKKLDDLINQNAPTGIVSNNNMPNWYSRMSELLISVVENYNESCGKSLDDLLQEALPAAYNRATAEVLAKQLMGPGAIKNLVDTTVGSFGYKLEEDEVLASIIENYISNKINATEGNQWTAADIEKQIKEVINLYLATAEITNTTSTNTNLADYGYDNSQLNPAQKAMLVKKLNENLSSERSNFKGYEEQFDAALAKFVDNYVKTLNITAENGKALYETVLGKLDDIRNSFKNSDDYKKLEVTKEVYSRFRDNISDAFKTAIRYALGDDADEFLANMKSSDNYKKVLDDIISRINSGDEALMTNGKVDYTKVNTEIIEKIKSLAGTSSRGTAATGELDELKEAYLKADDDAQKKREAAIKYCDAAVAKGGEYANAVKTVFGSATDYADKINKMDTYELAGRMNALFNAIAQISPYTEADLVSWDDGTKDKSFNAGMSTTISPTAILANGAGTITYKVTDTKNCVASSTNGNITITPSSDGIASVTVDILCNDKKVTTKTISVNVTKITTEEYIKSHSISFNGVADGSSGHLEVYGCAGITDGSQVKNSSFATLYNGNAIIQLHSGDTDGDWNEFKKSSTVQGRLKNLLNMITGALANSGMDKTKLQKASDKVYQKFGNTSRWEAHKNRFSGGRANYCSNKMQTGEYSTDTIVKQHDDIKNSGDKVTYMVSFRALVDAIFEEYNSMA